MDRPSPSKLPAPAARRSPPPPRAVRPAGLRLPPGLLLLLLLLQSAAAQDDIRLGTLLNDPVAGPIVEPVAAARRGAAGADAALYAEGSWRRAERVLDRLLGDLERGRVDAARERAPEAVALFRTAHGEALETVLLAEASAALREAARSDLQALVPRMLARADRTLAEAQRTLARSPDGAERAAALAARTLEMVMQAREAATALRELAAQAGTEEATPEMVLTAWLHAMDTVQRTLDGTPAPRAPSGASVADAGAGEGDRAGSGDDAARGASATAPADATGGGADASTLPGGDPRALSARTRDAAQTLRERVEALRIELDTRNALVRELQGRLTEVDARLDDAARARTAMARELARQEQTRARLQSLRRMFDEDEAELLREGDVYVLRVTGLGFAVGGTDVGAGAGPLLDKIADAIRLFPASTVVVEGHTDATGDAALNERVSRERAASVRRALLARTGMAQSRMTSTGRGEARPVASNETAAGRARNRRIEIRIDPREQDDMS